MQGFSALYLIVPKKSGGLRPILGLRILNWAFHKLPFKMITQNRIFRMHLSPRSVCSVRPEGPVLPCVDPSAPQAIPAVCVLRTSISVQGPALRAVPIAPCLHKSSGGSPCSIERTGRAHSQLPQRLAHTGSVSGSVMRTQGFGALAPQPVGPSGQLGKEQTLEDAEDLFSQYGVGFGRSCLTQERAQSVFNCLNTFKSSTAVPLNQFQRLLGHMRPPQHWPHGRVPRWAWQRGTGSESHRSAAKPSPPGTGLQACCGLHGCLHHRLRGHVQRACSVGSLDGSPTALAHQSLELLAVHLALNCLKRCLRGKHVLVHTDNTATVAYINRQGGLRSHRMSQLARHLLLWSPKHLRSLRATHIPGLLNWAADDLSRAALPGEWRLHPQTVQLIWRRFGLSQVDLFAYLETSHFQLFYSLTEGTLGTAALAHSWPRSLRQYVLNPVSLLAQTLCRSGRMRSRSCSWPHISPLGLGSRS